MVNNGERSSEIQKLTNESSSKLLFIGQKRERQSELGDKTRDNNDKIVSTQQELKEITRKKNDTTKEKNELESERTTQEKNLGSVKTKKTSVEKDVVNRTKNIDAKKQRIRELTGTPEGLEADVPIVHSEDTSAVENEVLQLQKDIKSDEEVNIKSEEEIKKLESEINGINQKITQLTQDIQGKEKIILGLEEEGINKQNQLTALGKIQKDLITQTEAITKEIAQDQKDINKIQREIDYYHGLYVAHESLERESKSLSPEGFMRDFVSVLA